MTHRTPTILFSLCFLILWMSLLQANPPYTYDSAELTVGAYTLGLVHGPGYPLYLVLAHLFAHLPFGSVLDRVSLFSALCLALTAPLTYHILTGCGLRRVPATVAAFTVVWLYPLWSIAIIPEVYASQVLTLALTGWSCIRFRRHYNGWTSRAAALVGGSYGIALGVHPGSILFLPGILAALLAMKMNRRHMAIFSGALALVLTAALLYFPIRYGTKPAINMLGRYDRNGIFHAVDLAHLDGILWTISGQQFHNLFFTAGVVPTTAQLAQTLQMFALQLHVLPTIATLIGLIHMIVTRRSLLWLWLLLFVPFVAFYSAYGAADRQTMFGPAYLLLSLPIAFGVERVMGVLPKSISRVAVAGMPLVALVMSSVNLASPDDRLVAQPGSDLPCVLPADAIVFADWRDVTLLQYQQLVHGKYLDVTAYNLFLFDDDSLSAFLGSDALYQSARPVVMLSQDVTRYLNDHFPSAAPVLCTASQRPFSSSTALSSRAYELVRSNHHDDADHPSLRSVGGKRFP